MRSLLTVQLNGMTYLLTGGEGHPAGERVDPASRHASLAAYARSQFGTGPVAYRWSTQDAMPLDGLPYAGPLNPDSRHAFVITGLRKWGLTNGTAAALMLADLLNGTANGWAPLFDSNRAPSPTGTRPEAATTSKRAEAGTSDGTRTDDAARKIADLAPQ